jgi:NADH:ubiquinone oxidoreductase subunit 6 (subunit J)
LTTLLGNLKHAALHPPAAEVAAAAQARLAAPAGILSEHHMANLGRHLFSTHLVSVEVAGTLLLAALVGAVAIAIQGKPRLAQRIEEALR